MNYDDMAHMADQERKREREEGDYTAVTVPLKQWQEQNAEIARLRQELDIVYALVREG